MQRILESSLRMLTLTVKTVTMLTQYRYSYSVHKLFASNAPLPCSDTVLFLEGGTLYSPLVFSNPPKILFFVESYPDEFRFSVKSIVLHCFAILFYIIINILIFKFLFLIEPIYCAWRCTTYLVYIY